ncbi:MAG: Allophanate hydrolase [Candidatus Moranbacteria bacterium GW2011_GWE2_35_2-]|nr:MAG: Allophanate hydrolase [Candidatus Moranbacteria bacterium GW2011_GWE2_35_2-]KKQ22450.1 MAG: Allophanate hydrolase [Candidatus Moranbacteria bacterium GW2011_GWF2_37_11]KKQ29519.1 MAG: Allophanate hydrolase [Candidatus Moranbacteria bacterium GW2011_GWD1_37_17]KKQ30611.1 MAG: Allophanate hydrolase [Candidatus Moranbacteria bacterium GW2011_GWE1_37_24]KKQ48165.1 MAG: Allophanate hydrolase [Candidatus Moranbacteria bacterium GW2011_GWD2_37_9]HBO17144.1 allophanate hydrolase [Candidatus Mo
MSDKYVKTTTIKWEEIQKDVFEKQCVTNKNGLNFSILKIKPNKKIPLHNHTDTRYNYILKGSMSDENQTYQKGDLLINEKGSKHFLKAGSEGCEFILIWN